MGGSYRVRPKCTERRARRRAVAMRDGAAVVTTVLPWRRERAPTRSSSWRSAWAAAGERHWMRVRLVGLRRLVIRNEYHGMRQATTS